jgi:hypothetical protein
LLSPVSRQIVAQDAPLLRSKAILRAATITRGLPKLAALCLGIPQASPDTLGNQATLKLGHGPQDGENHLARWRSCVDRFR